MNPSNTTIATTLVLLVMTCLTRCTCQKDRIHCGDDQSFCAIVAAESFAEMALLFNNHLADDKDDSGAEDLEKLLEWLDCKHCVDEVKLICN